MPSTELAGYANLALYSAMVVFAVTMLVFTAHLAALGPPADLADAEESAGDKILVGAGAASADDSGPAGPAEPGPSAATIPDSGIGGAAPADSMSSRARSLGSVGISLTWLATLLLVAAVAMRGIAVTRPPWG
ncbi:MAG TPA: hypothetical protein VHM65_07835, partial [Candidatus Lustribacter sp.]|nr:hypothetical protein [Candidatus Lustribacter sp.]